MKTKTVEAKKASASRCRTSAKTPRAAYAAIAEAPAGQKDMALVQSALCLRDNAEKILAANAKDVKEAKEKGLDAAMIDRLMLDEKRVEAMAAGLETIATMPDPVNKKLEEWDRPNGLLLQRVRFRSASSASSMNRAPTSLPMRRDCASNPATR